MMYHDIIMILCKKWSTLYKTKYYKKKGLHFVYEKCYAVCYSYQFNHPGCTILSIVDTVNRVRNGESIPFRPILTDAHDFGLAMVKLVRTCWSERAEDRPTFVQIRSQLRKIAGGT